MNVAATAGQVGHQAKHSDWLDWAVRLGLTAYGVVHLLIAWLALKIAFGTSGRHANSKGAMHELATTGLGRASLYVVAVGLFALVVWQGLEALYGHRAETGGKRTFKRVVSGAKVVLYGGLGISALRTATGSHSSKSGGTHSTTAKLMAMPAGPLLVAVVGVVILCVAGFMVRRGWTEKFLKKLDGKGRTGHDGKAYRMFGKVGYIGKGAALAIVGGLFLWAAATHNAKRSGGLDQALHRLASAPFGTFLLVAVAAGIACYGLFCFAWARHLRK